LPFPAARQYDDGGPQANEKSPGTRFPVIITKDEL
jgi:hypothetical protein